MQGISFFPTCLFLFSTQNMSVVTDMINQLLLVLLTDNNRVW